MHSTPKLLLVAVGLRCEGVAMAALIQAIPDARTHHVVPVIVDRSESAQEEGWFDIKIHFDNTDGTVAGGRADLDALVSTSDAVCVVHAIGDTSHSGVVAQVCARASATCPSIVIGIGSQQEWRTFGNVSNATPFGASVFNRILSEVALSASISARQICAPGQRSQVEKVASVLRFLEKYLFTQDPAIFSPATDFLWPLRDATRANFVCTRATGADHALAAATKACATMGTTGRVRNLAILIEACPTCKGTSVKEIMSFIRTQAWVNPDAAITVAWSYDKALGLSETRLSMLGWS